MTASVTVFIVGVGHADNTMACELARAFHRLRVINSTHMPLAMSTTDLDEHRALTYRYGWHIFRTNNECNTQVTAVYHRLTAVQASRSPSIATTNMDQAADAILGSKNSMEISR